MTRYSDRDDSVEDPVAYQDAEQLYPKPHEPAVSEYVRPSLEDLLAFEGKWGNVRGGKEGAIRNTFHCGAVRYYQLLNAAIDDPRSLEVDAMLIHRLADQRAERLRQRNSRRFEKRTR